MTTSTRSSYRQPVPTKRGQIIQEVEHQQWSQGKNMNMSTIELVNKDEEPLARTSSIVVPELDDILFGTRNVDHHPGKQLELQPTSP
jgi:hypothetical protein